MTDYRAALEAIRDALALPYAATAGGDEVRAGLLDNRVMLVRHFLKAVLDDHRPTLDLDFEIRFMTDRIARQPAEAQYVTYDQVQAALAKGATWTEAVTLPTPTTEGDTQ